MSENAKMISIWLWVGLVLGVYGLIITGTGIYYLFDPAPLAGKVGGNSNLWWGLVILVAGVVFTTIGKLDKGGE